MGRLVPNCICLAAILMAMIVCFVMLILSVVKAIKQGKKKELPNLDSYAVCCIASLLCTLLITCFNGTALWINNTYHLNSLGFGPVVLSAIVIGLLWIGGRFIASFVLRILEARDKNEIISNAFKLVEMILLVTIVFQIVVGFVTMKLNIEEEGMTFGFMLEILPFAFFADAYERYPSTKQISNVVLSTIVLAVVLSFVIVMCVFLFKSFRTSFKQKQKACLTYGIVSFIMAIVFLVLTCITRTITMQKDGLADLFTQMLNALGLLSDETEGIGVFVSSNVIVGVVLGAMLLTSEIVWLGLSSKESKKEKQL